MAEQQKEAATDAQPLSKKELKAKEKADKKTAKAAQKKKVKKVDPIKATLRNMYWVIMAMALALVVWLGYEAAMIFISNTRTGS